MCLSTQTSQEYSWLARKWTILCSRFNLEGHSTEPLISEMVRHPLIFYSNLKTTVQQCFLTCSVWPYLQSFTHSFIHLLNIYHMSALLSHKPHVSEEETSNQPNSISHDQYHYRKVKSAICKEGLMVQSEWRVGVRARFRESFQENITCRWRPDGRRVERKYSRQKE